MVLLREQEGCREQKKIASRQDPEIPLKVAADESTNREYYADCWHAALIHEFGAAARARRLRRAVQFLGYIGASAFVLNERLDLRAAVKPVEKRGQVLPI